MISDLQIAPTAAYLLASPSAPEEARILASEKAEGGEKIKPKMAKEILAEKRKAGGDKKKSVAPEKFGTRLSGGAGMVRGAMESQRTV